MPRPTCPPADFENAIKDYVAGESAQVCAARWHTAEKRLTDALKARGLFRSPAERKAIKARKMRETAIADLGIDIDELARRYHAGESENALADAYGVSRSAIAMRLDAAGVERRNQTEANQLLAEQTPQEEHLRRIAIAQEAATGITQTEEHRCNIALTVERRQTNVSASERLVIDWLRERGESVIPQKAIGRYNVDIGAAPIAVEILGGSWHASKDTHAERSRYILDRGWHLIFIWTHATRSPLQPEVADYIVACREGFRRNPPTIGQYRVIRGDGHFLAAGSANDDNISPVVPGYESYGNGS